MTEFLVRRFVQNYENTENHEVRTRYGILSSVVGIICNVLLFSGKMAIGILLRSISVTADAFNNLSDAASSIISYIGVKMAEKPADDEHPFGYGRMEYIAAFIVSFLVIQVGFTFFKSSIGKIRAPGELAFEPLPFLFLLLSVAVKLWLGLFNRRLGRRIDSKVMLATSADSLGDVMTTGVTILSILIYRFAGLNVDAWAGLIVSLIVMWAGVGIARETLEPLIGEPIDPQLYRRITEMVRSFDGIVDVHDLIVHNYGPNRSMASIHAEVTREMNIDRAHDLIDRIERYVARKLDVMLVIHVDPVEVNDERTLRLREQLTAIVEGIDERLTLHDFRVLYEEDYTDLSFDLLVPYEYDKERQDEVELRILEKINELDGRFLCAITIDKSYVNL